MNSDKPIKAYPCTFSSVSFMRLILIKNNFNPKLVFARTKMDSHAISTVHSTPIPSHSVLWIVYLLIYLNIISGSSSCPLLNNEQITQVCVVKVLKMQQNRVFGRGSKKINRVHVLVVAGFRSIVDATIKSSGGQMWILFWGSQ